MEDLNKHNIVDGLRTVIWPPQYSYGYRQSMINSSSITSAYTSFNTAAIYTANMSALTSRRLTDMHKH